MEMTLLLKVPAWRRRRRGWGRSAPSARPRPPKAPKLAPPPRLTAEASVMRPGVTPVSFCRPLERKPGGQLTSVEDHGRCACPCRRCAGPEEFARLPESPPAPPIIGLMATAASSLRVMLSTAPACPRCRCRSGVDPGERRVDLGLVLAEIEERRRDRRRGTPLIAGRPATSRAVEKREEVALRAGIAESHPLDRRKRRHSSARQLGLVADLARPAPCRHRPPS